MLHGWRGGALELLRRALGIFGLGVARRAGGGAGRGRRRSPSSASRARAERDFAEADRLRGEIEAAGWEVRDGDGGSSSFRGRDAATSSTGAGPCARRCAGRREVLELWATRARARSGGLAARGARPRVQVEARARPHRAPRARATTRASSRACEPYRVRRRVRARRAGEPLLACLDQVTDPRNLGAVCRSAEGAGATGVVLPAHGSARVTPAVCSRLRRRCRAPARRRRVRISRAI